MPSPSPQKELVNDADLTRKSVRGGAITIASQFFNALLQLASAVVLARLLSPEEFGLVAMVTAIITFANLFLELGLTTSTIQRANITPKQLSTVFWINVFAGIVLAVAVATASPLIAIIYGRDELLFIALILSINFVTSSLGSQPGALLTREMKFGRFAAATIIGSIANLGISVTLALQGYSYWSLVIGSVIGVLTTSLLRVALCGWWPGLPTKDPEIVSMIRFGANIMAVNVANYFARNLDNILIGKYSGATDLGMYSRAYYLLMFPISNLRDPIIRVALPVLSKLQTDPTAFRAYYRRIAASLAFLSMPGTTFLFSFSTPIIHLTLGADWVGTIPLFKVLAIVAFIQPCASTTALVCMSLGLGQRFLRVGVAAALLTSVGFVIGIQWGALGIATSYAITTYSGLIPSVLWSLHRTPVHISDLARAVRNPAAASIVSGLIAWLLKPMTQGLQDWETLAIGLPLFSISYLSIYAMLPGGVRELKEIKLVLKSIATRSQTSPER